MAERYVETLRLITQAWQCDHMGHVNVGFYMGWLGDAAFAMLALHGLDREQAAAEKLGAAAVRAEVDYQSELRGGDMVRLETTVESIGERKIVFHHRMIRIGDEKQIMRARVIGVCIDTVQRKSRAFPTAFIERVANAFSIEPALPKSVAA
jgi:acyl-CoA thioester hydrolase